MVKKDNHMSGDEGRCGNQCKFWCCMGISCHDENNLTFASNVTISECHVSVLIQFHKTHLCCVVVPGSIKYTIRFWLQKTMTMIFCSLCMNFLPLVNDAIGWTVVLAWHLCNKSYFVTSHYSRTPVIQTNWDCGLFRLRDVWIIRKENM